MRRSHNNTSQTFRLTAEYINRFSDAVCDIFFLYLLHLCFGNSADDCPVYFTIPAHTHFIIGLYLFRFRVVFPYLLGGEIQSAAVKHMKFFFVIFYKKIDKVGIKMLYLVNKILLLQKLCWPEKEAEMKTAVVGMGVLTTAVLDKYI